MAEGGLENQDITGDDLGRLGGERGAQAEISGVEDSSSLAPHQDLRRAAHMTGRMKGQLQWPEIEGLTVRGREAAGALTELRRHQRGGRRGRNDPLMAREMIGVGVRDEGQRPRPAGIQKQRTLGDPHARRRQLHLGCQRARHERGFTLVAEEASDAPSPAELALSSEEARRRSARVQHEGVGDRGLRGHLPGRRGGERESGRGSSVQIGCDHRSQLPAQGHELKQRDPLPHHARQ